MPEEAVATYLTLDLFIDMMQTCGCKTAVMNNVFTCARKDGKMK